MGRSTFSGPIRSMRGFIRAGPDAVISLTADTTLTFADHAGRIIELNDADGKFTLPAILAGSKEASAGDDDPNVASHIGAVYSFIIGTAATDLDILTDGTDKFVGHIGIGITNSTFKIFTAGSSNDVMTMNGTTKGGIVGSYVTFTVLAALQYHVEGLLAGSSTIVTPFADS